MTCLDVELAKSYIVTVEGRKRIAVCVGRAKGALLMRLRVGPWGRPCWRKPARKVQPDDVLREAQTREVWSGEIGAAS